MERGERRVVQRAARRDDFAAREAAERLDAQPRREPREGERQLRVPAAHRELARDACAQPDRRGLERLPRHRRVRGRRRLRRGGRPRGRRSSRPAEEPLARRARGAGPHGQRRRGRDDRDVGRKRRRAPRRRGTPTTPVLLGDARAREGAALGVDCSDAQLEHGVDGPVVRYAQSVVGAVVVRALDALAVEPTVGRPRALRAAPVEHAVAPRRAADLLGRRGGLVGRAGRSARAARRRRGVRRQPLGPRLVVGGEGLVGGFALGGLVIVQQRAGRVLVGRFERDGGLDEAVAERAFGAALDVELIQREELVEVGFQ
mmetsp:Transcript_23151/g.91854  ORF Transcript_23151/g.91854 Transcript_23151/m.91854 type:complete len:316 (-) Transcript_23151:105-1052(-)